MSKEKIKPKLFSVMKTYSKEQFFKDLIAGVIVAIIALPLSIALALASGRKLSGFEAFTLAHDSLMKLL